MKILHSFELNILKIFSHFAGRKRTPFFLPLAKMYILCLFDVNTMTDKVRYE